MKERCHIIKVGTNTLARDDGLNEAAFERIAGQVQSLRQEGGHVVLVTSGAVKAGRLAMHGHGSGGDHGSSLPADIAKYEAIGSRIIMERWQSALDIPSAGCELLSRQELEGDKRLQTLERLNDVLRQNGVVVINERSVNDAAGYGNNDFLAGAVTAGLATGGHRSVGSLIFVTNTNGILADCADPRSTIREVRNLKEIDLFVRPEYSADSKGGMQTKVDVARHVAAHGVDTYITNAQGGAILGALRQQSGTRIAHRHLSIGI